LPQLQAKARQADLEYSGLNRNQLVDRLQPHMDEALNILQPFTGKRFAFLGGNKDELIEKAESPQSNGLVSEKMNVIYNNTLIFVD
jgi:hypothetical protein